MPTVVNKRIVDVGLSALHDLYGLVPQKDRKYADDYMRTLENVINAYSDTLNHMRQIETALHFGGRYIEQKLTEIETVEG